MALKKLLKGLKGVGKEIVKGAKGSKEHQESVAKKDAGKGGKNWYPGKYAKKAVKQVAKDVKAAAKGSKEYQAGKAKRKAAKAKKKEGKTWTKAVKAQKKAGTGETLSSLVSKRSNLTKGTSEYAKVQNAINKAYGVKKRHKATVASPAKTFGKEGIKKAAKKATDVSGKLQYQTPMKDVIDTKDRLAKQGKYREEAKAPVPKEKKKLKVQTHAERKKMEGGGKVEANPYGWPTSDARGRK